MTFAEWFEKFDPIENTFNSYAEPQYSFERFGEELNCVENSVPECIWTEVTTDGANYIVSGLVRENAYRYFITMKPWDVEGISVIL